MSVSLKRNNNKDVNVLEIHIKAPVNLQLNEKIMNTVLKSKDNKTCMMMTSGTRRFEKDIFVVHVGFPKKK